MRVAVAWSLFALGVAHVVFGVLRFKDPLAGAWADGFTGQFQAPEIRRTAFWFILVGPLLMFAGQVAVFAVSSGNDSLLRLLGTYLLVTGLVGVAAFPKSPLWAPLVLSLPLLAMGWGWWKGTA